MNLSDVQSALNGRGWTPPLALDGAWGAKTSAAVADFLASQQVTKAPSWPTSRKILAAQQALCRLAGIDAGAIDGLMGPQTRYALEVWDARAKGDTTAETWRDSEGGPATLPQGPVHNVWPVQSDVARVFGKPGENQAMLALPYPMRLAWDLDVTVSRMSIHEQVHDSAKRVLERVLDAYGPTGIRTLGLDLFGGCLNVRTMRGGSALSMHAWGIAIDIDPDRNQLKWGRDKARLARPDAETWWRLWEEEGWISLGRARDYDWMHVQAARL